MLVGLACVTSWRSTGVVTGLFGSAKPRAAQDCDIAAHAVRTSASDDVLNVGVCGYDMHDAVTEPARDAGRAPAGATAAGRMPAPADDRGAPVAAGAAHMLASCTISTRLVRLSVGARPLDAGLSSPAVPYMRLCNVTQQPEANA